MRRKLISSRVHFDSHVSIITTFDAYNDSYARKRKIGRDSDHVSSLAQEFSSRDVSPRYLRSAKENRTNFSFVEAVESYLAMNYSTNH